MDPKPETPQSGQLFGFPLIAHLNQHHPLILFVALINWKAIYLVAPEPVPLKRGRPEVLRK